MIHHLLNLSSKDVNIHTGGGLCERELQHEAAVNEVI